MMPVQRAYKRFRRTYRPFLNGARREMGTTLQKSLVDTIAALAFQAGYNTRDQEAPASPVRLKPFTRRHK